MKACLVICDVVVGTHALYLCRCEYPANIVDDLNVGSGRFLELEQLGGLHQVLELEGALRHVMRLTPLLDTGYVVLNLHR